MKVAIRVALSLLWSYFAVLWFTFYTVSISHSLRLAMGSAVTRNRATLYYSEMSLHIKSYKRSQNTI